MGTHADSGYDVNGTVALVEELGYVALATPDIAASTAFFRDVCQLEVSEERADAVFLRGDDAHHWVRLEPRPAPGVLRVGYRATGPAAIEEVIRRLEARCIAWTKGGDVRADRVVGAVRFRLGDVEIELFEEMARMPLPPRSTGLTMRLLLHAVFRVPDLAVTRDLWRDVLGFRRSDQIEDLAVFMRCGNRYHHSVGFLTDAQSAGALDHICILVDSIDDVMRMQNLAKRTGTPLMHEVLRHAASGSIGVYLRHEPLAMGVEYCVGHGQLADDDPGRLLIASASTVNVWNDLPGVPRQVAAGATDGDVYALLDEPTTPRR